MIICNKQTTTARRRNAANGRNPDRVRNHMWCNFNNPGSEGSFAETPPDISTDISTDIIHVKPQDTHHYTHNTGQQLPSTTTTSLNQNSQSPLQGHLPPNPCQQFRVYLRQADFRLHIPRLSRLAPHLDATAFGQHLAPRVHDHRLSVARPLRVVSADLRGCNHVRLRLDRAGAQQDLPMHLTSGDRESGRIRDDVGAETTER